MSKTFDKIIKEAKKTHKERAKIYRNTSTKFGDVMVAFFPDGITLATKDEWAEFGIFFQIVSKITRNSEVLIKDKTSHKDSIHDIGVYAFMLEEMQEQVMHARKKKGGKL